MFTDEYGRRITPEQFTARIKNAVLKQAKAGIDEIKRQEAAKLARQYGLSGAICPEHKCSPKNIRLEPDSPGSEQHHIVYDECCQQLVAEVSRIAHLQGL